jgi:hypothetical protein
MECEMAERWYPERRESRLGNVAMEPCHFCAGFGEVESCAFDVLGFGEGFVHKTEDIGAVAVFLEISAGDFRFDEAGDAFR